MEVLSDDPNLYSKCAEGKNGGRRYITHMEMIKGIQGHGYYDEFAVPIIGNVARERELTESLALASYTCLVGRLVDCRLCDVVEAMTWLLVF
ncbi:probable bifunctional methylthioribulose-1-phosphate dehydratase/enolase-phosphatase E1 [Tanacetum coccineum]